MILKSGPIIWFPSQSMKMHKPIHFKCTLRVGSPDRFALSKSVNAPKSSAPLNGATVVKPENIESTKAPIAPPMVAIPHRYRSLLHRPLSLYRGSDLRATRIVESIQKNNTMNPEEINSPPRMLMGSKFTLNERARVKKVEI